MEYNNPGDMEANSSSSDPSWAYRRTTTTTTTTNAPEVLVVAPVAPTPVPVKPSSRWSATKKIAVASVLILVAAGVTIGALAGTDKLVPENRPSPIPKDEALANMPAPSVGPSPITNCKSATLSYVGVGSNHTSNLTYTANIPNRFVDFETTMEVIGLQCPDGIFLDPVEGNSKSAPQTLVVVFESLESTQRFLAEWAIAGDGIDVLYFALLPNWGCGLAYRKAFQSPRMEKNTLVFVTEAADLSEVLPDSEVEFTFISGVPGTNSTIGLTPDGALDGDTSNSTSSGISGGGDRRRWVDIADRYSYNVQRSLTASTNIGSLTVSSQLSFSFSYRIKTNTFLSLQDMSAQTSLSGSIGVSANLRFSRGKNFDSSRSSSEAVIASFTIWVKVVPVYVEITAQAIGSVDVTASATASLTASASGSGSIGGTVRYSGGSSHFSSHNTWGLSSASLSPSGLINVSGDLTARLRLRVKFYKLVAPFADARLTVGVSASSSGCANNRPFGRVTCQVGVDGGVSLASFVLGPFTGIQTSRRTLLERCL